jgi:hypothetical protein
LKREVAGQTRLDRDGMGTVMSKRKHVFQIIVEQDEAGYYVS